ncbi:hypothetical protein EHQ81_06290 [Leptospira selangorensis]|uniref:Peptidase MA family protein n=1 Tax=Leptospira selangorensis TaxID=2484982 RepID=A0A5F2BZ15_9LEPT|nr:hypothetical protein [Leptospira selangorensis]TGM15995.1 hypothetical protein EHQ81_06290 [Leptospira selangorensis]TGM18055.1 hypothetical protein EHQ82_13415 [Leptospira selangorensis]
MINGFLYQFSLWMRIGILSAFLLSVFPLLSQNKKSSKTNESNFSFRLKGGEIKLAVRNETELKEWDKYAFEKTKRILDAYESYLGIPFHQASSPIFKTLPSSEKDKIRLVLKDTVFLNGTRVGGYNNVSGELGKELGIFMELGLVPPGYPALLLHELGHYYFTEPSWLSEGIVSYLPYLLSKRGYLKLDADELQSITEEWSLTEAIPKNDQPLSKDFHLSNPALGPWFYSKSVRTQFIIHKELGYEGYKSFLKHIASSEMLNTELVFKILNKVQRKDWNKILQGWVEAGPYSGYPPNSFMKIQDIEKL